MHIKVQLSASGSSLLRSNNVEGGQEMDCRLCGGGWDLWYCGAAATWRPNSVNVQLPVVNVTNPFIMWWELKVTQWTSNYTQACAQPSHVSCFCILSCHSKRLCDVYFVAILKCFPPIMVRSLFMSLIKWLICETVATCFLLMMSL